MKLGFFHDTPLIKSQGRYYSSGFGKEIWARYLEVFDEIVVSTRLIESDPSGLGISSAPRVSFAPIESYSSPLSLIRSFAQVSREIRERLENVDCAVVRLPSIIGWIASFEARKMNKPIVIELVGCPWDSYRHHSLSGLTLAPVAYFATRAAIRKAKFVIYVTQNFLQKRYPTTGKSVGISNVNISTDYSRLKNRLDKEKCRPTIIGSIGKIDLKYKGHRSTIEAISLLRRDGYDVEYEVVGPGNSKSLSELAGRLGVAGHVRFRGTFSRPEILEWLENIDIYVQPSLSEGLPRSVIEAMAHGLPTILSDVGGHPELVSREFLFSPGDSVELTKRIEKLIESDFNLVAEKNFAKSTEYDAKKLQEKRVNFLLNFKKYVLNSTVS